MINNESYLLAKQHVKAGETVKVWSNLLVDSIIIKAPFVMEGTLYSLYEVVTEENRHGGWFWGMETKLIGDRSMMKVIDEFIFAKEADL